MTFQDGTASECGYMSIDSTRSHIVLVKMSNFDMQRFTFDGVEIPAPPVKFIGDGLAYMSASESYFKGVKLPGPLRCVDAAATEQLFGLEILGLVYKKCLQISDLNYKWPSNAKMANSYILRININLTGNIISVHRKKFDPFDESSIRSKLMQQSRGTIFEAMRHTNGFNEWYLKPQGIKEQIQSSSSHTMSNKSRIIEDHKEYERHVRLPVAYSLRSFTDDLLHVDDNTSQVHIFKAMSWNRYQHISKLL